jgi:hypothetical protein
VDPKSAVDALIYLWKNSAPFNGTNALYTAVRFVPEYPLNEVGTPVVAVSEAGGGSDAKEVGYYNRWRRPRLQVDVLAGDILAARRIVQRMRAALLQDLNHGKTTVAVGQPGRGYLHAQGMRRAVLGEARPEPWDEAGRVARVVADLDIRFSD